MCLPLSYNFNKLVVMFFVCPCPITFVSSQDCKEQAFHFSIFPALLPYSKTAKNSCTDSKTKHAHLYGTISLPGHIDIDKDNLRGRR